MRKTIVVITVVAMVATAGVVWAANLGGILLTTVGVGALVKATAGPVDKFINTAMQNRHMPAGTSTKVVPVLSVGRKGYIGAMQVAGAGSYVSKAKAVVQVETEFDHGRYRIKLLVPTESSNPLEFNRIQGLGATAMVDMGLTGGDYEVPNTRSMRAGDILLAGGIGLAVKEFGPQINDFINKVAGTKGGRFSGATKVVPYLSFGEKAYIGAMQVAGPATAVNKVKAVWQYEDLFDGGRFRVRALVPTDSINPLSLRRVSGVGCVAVIDTVVARQLEAKNHPTWASYHSKYPLFVGDADRGYRQRPPGWDRGRKEGWIKHGNPYAPPGQSKTTIVTPIGGLKIAVPADKEKDKDEPKGKGKGKGK